MPEGLESVIRECYKVWRKNPVLGAPFLMNAAINVFLIVAFIALVFFLLNPLKGTGMQFNISMINWGFLLLDILLLMILIFIMHVLSAFFRAGSIGMAKKALETGKTSLDDLAESGRKKFLQIFAARLIIFAAASIVGLLLLIPQFILQGEYLTMSPIAFVIVFALVDYAIVLSDIGIVDGLSKGFNFFKANMFETVLLWSFTRVLESAVLLACVVLGMLIIGASTLFMPLGDLSAESIAKALGPSLMILVIAAGVVVIVFILALSYILSPLVTLFFSRFYMGRAGKGA